MDLSDQVFTAFACVSAVILILGLLLNSLVFATFAVHRRLFSKKENVYIFSMALSDLLCCAVSVPTSLISNISKKWMFGSIGCNVHAFVATWCGLVSITHLSALALNRHEAINALQQQILVDKRALLVVTMLWLYSFSFAIAPVAGWSRYTTEGIGTSCSVHWQLSDANAVSYTICIFLGCFVTPVTVILISYFKVYKAIREMTGNANSTWGNLSEHAKETAKAETKMATLMLAMIIAFLFAWTPYAVVSLISACGGSHLISPVVASVPAYLAKASTLCNPILYFLLYKRFRRKAIKLLCPCKSYRNRKKTPVLPFKG